MEGGINLFVYALNNPINWVDIKGLVCGSGWTDYIVTDDWILFNFKDACQWHDDCYGGKYELEALSKAECDAKFHDKIVKHPQRGLKLLL